MSVLDHPIEFLPTSSWIDSGSGKSDRKTHTKPPTRRLKRLSLLNGRDSVGGVDANGRGTHARTESDEHTPTHSTPPLRRASDSTEPSSSVSPSTNNLSRRSTLSMSTPRRYNAPHSSHSHKLSTDSLARRSSRSSVSYSARHSLDSFDGSANDSAGGMSTLTPTKTPPMTLFDQHAPLLAQIAHKESVVNDLKNELDIHEKELRRLRGDWRRIASGHGGHKRSGSSEKVLSPKRLIAPITPQTRTQDTQHAQHTHTHSQPLDRSASMRGRLISPVSQSRRVPGSVEQQQQHYSHSSHPSQATPNVYLQQGVDILVEGVGAFWDTLRSGPGATPGDRR